MPIKHKKLPTSGKLKQYYRYCPESGKLFWLKGSSMGEGRQRRTEREAGSKMFPDTNSYLVTRLEGQIYMVHRLIWRMMTGKDPGRLEIDHVNGVKDDNRWMNLRLATHDHNNQNTKVQKNNTSGFKGVAWHRQRQAWRAYISIGPREKSKQISLGLHSTPEQAAGAVRKYREELHGEFHNHG